MGADSRVLLLGLRIWQLICSVIVLGILGSFLHRLSDAGVSRDGRVVYSIVTASISTVFSIVFIAPFLYDFLAFPGDFILWIMWLITFCLLITRTGGSTCTSPWFWDYWGYYWGGWWRRPTIVTGPADIGYSGCAQWRTVLAFSFMAMFAFFVSPILGAYAVVRYWKGTKDDERTEKVSTAVPTSQMGPTPVGPPPGQTGSVVDTAPGAAPGAGQPT